MLVIDQTFGSAELQLNFLKKSRDRSFPQRRGFGRTLAKPNFQPLPNNLLQKFKKKFPLSFASYR